MDPPRIERLVRDVILQYGFPVELTALESDEARWYVSLRTRDGRTIRVDVDRMNDVAQLRERLRECIDDAC